MGFFDSYPYTDVNELNLDWVIEKFGEIDEAVLGTIKENVIAKIEEICTEEFLTDKMDPEIESVVTKDFIWNLVGAEVESLIAEKHNRKILFVGDSYGTVMNDVQPFTYYLSDWLPSNITFVNVCVGGTGFTTDSSFYDQLNDTTATGITDIIVIGGYNDRNASVDDITAAINTFKTLANTKYPDAKVSIGHFGWHAGLASTQRELLYTHSVRAYRKCIDYGCLYMTNSEYTMHNYNLFQSDDLHPTATGQLAIASQMLMYILNGTCDVHYPYKAVTISSGYNTSTEYSIGSSLDNGIVHVELSAGNIAWSNKSGLTANENSQLLQVTTKDNGNRLYAIGNFDGQINLQTLLNAIGYHTKTSGNSFLPFSDSAFWIQGGYIWCRPMALNSDQNGFADYSDIDSTMFRVVSGNIETLLC